MAPTTKAVVSTGADPDASSFLNLPAEIRNLVYQLLFVSEDNLQLAEVADGSIALVRRSPADDAAETEYFQKMRARNFVIEVNPSPDPTLPRPHRIQQDGLHLLRACRQVHSEAAPILYSNTFLLHARRNCYYDRTGQHFNAASAAWLGQIGQCIEFVQKLVIDLGNIGPSNCSCGGRDSPETFRERDDYIRLGSLVNTIWSSGSDMTVSFVDSGPIPSVCMCIPWQSFGSLSPHRDTHRLSQVVQQIIQDDLGMKKFKRAIGEIGISPNGLDGVFLSKTTDWQRRQTELYTWSGTLYVETNLFYENARFFESTNNAALRFCNNQAAKKPKTVLGFPSKVFDTILQYTLDSVASYNIDLDLFVDFRSLCGILYVNRDLHCGALNDFLLNHNFKISMTAEPTGNFETSKLRRLLNFSIKWHVQFDPYKAEYAPFGVTVDFSIDLHVHSDIQASSSSPNGPHFNVLPLIVATFEAKVDRLITVHFHNCNGQVKRNTISILALRQLVVPVLRKYVREEHAKDAGVLCPELWMDSQGVIDAVYTGSVVLGNRQDPAKELRTLWSAGKTGYMGEKVPPVPEVGGLARSMYLYLEWITV